MAIDLGPDGLTLGSTTINDWDDVGITEYDQWRITTGIEYTGSGSTDITTNWERNDNNFDYIGTGMSESSGVFTFPSTGKWLMLIHASFYSATDLYYVGIRTYVSGDSGSSYSKRSEVYTQNVTGGATKYTHANIFVGLDVTNSSTFRVKFNIDRYSTVNLDGNTNEQRSGITFIRLGGT